MGILTTIHIKCGGELNLNHSEGDKTIYYCSKCKRYVNIIVFPSYNDYVEMGLIKEV